MIADEFNVALDGRRAQGHPIMHPNSKSSNQCTTTYKSKSQVQVAPDDELALRYIIGFPVVFHIPRLWSLVQLVDSSPKPRVRCRKAFV